MKDDINRKLEQDKTSSHDQRLIEELYEKLWWYTYEASEEEFNDREVQAITQLLDILDPLYSEPEFEKQASFERFKDRFGLQDEFKEKPPNLYNEEFAADFGLTAEDVMKAKAIVSHDDKDRTSESRISESRTNESSEDLLKGKLADFLLKAHAEEEGVENTDKTSGSMEELPPADRTSEEIEAETEKSESETKSAAKIVHKFRLKKFALRFGMGIAACIVLMLTLNMGTYALKQKSFFEIVKSEFGRTKVTVTGNVDEVEFDEEVSSYDTWEEVETMLDKYFLKPNYLPEDYCLKKIYCGIEEVKYEISARYVNEKNNSLLVFGIYSYGSSYSDGVYSDIKDSNLLYVDNDKNAKFYSVDGKIKVIFICKNNIYTLVTDEPLEIVKSIVANIM